MARYYVEFTVNGEEDGYEVEASCASKAEAIVLSESTVAIVVTSVSVVGECGS